MGGRKRRAEKDTRGRWEIQVRMVQWGMSSSSPGEASAGCGGLALRREVLPWGGPRSGMPACIWMWCVNP